jgi:GNAT superfamily N-acetyltransferase
MSEYEVRRMHPDEMDQVIEWAAAEGWNPGRDDAALFYDTDPHGFFVGLLDGVPVASLSGVAYGESFGFLGFYIVRPDLRGRGYGIRLWQVALDYLGGRTIGLDGVPAQQENYARSGFRLAWRNIRYEGTGRMAEPADGVVPIKEVSLDSVLEADRWAFPTARADFVRRWISQPNGWAYAAVSSGELAGFGVIRRCKRGFKIGPLTAIDEHIAHALFTALAAKASEDPIFLDVPAANPRAVALAAHLGMSPVFETARMYNREPPSLALERIFGITSFELG